MRIINVLSRMLSYLAMVALMAMMMLIVTDVFFRFFLKAPISGTTELSELMMVVIVFPTLAWSALVKKHVHVDIVVSRFPARVQVIIGTIMLLAALGIYAVITWGSIIESMTVNSITSLLRIPDAPFYWIMAGGWAVFCLAIIVLLLKNLTGEVER